MTSIDPGAPQRRGSTTDQARGDIQRGRTGDKVAGFDPAAAPLGADEEAGGTPTSPELAERTRLEARAGRPSGARTNAATPELQPDARLKNGQSGMLLAALVGIGAAAALAVALLAAL